LNTHVKIKLLYQMAAVFLILIVAAVGFRYINMDQFDESVTIVDSMEPPFDPVELGLYLGENIEIGSLTTYKLPVTQNIEDSSASVGYGSVYGLDRKGIAYQVGYDKVILLDQNNEPISYPLDLKTSTVALELNNVLDSRQVSITGELYNCSGWDDSWFLALKVDNQFIYSVKDEPKPLTAAQVRISTDSDYYHPADTATITIRNLSEDWLGAGRTLSLFRDVNGSWVETQGYPDDYFITLEIVMFFPGSTWSHQLPLYHLEEGTYRLVKEVWHDDKPKVEIETCFTVVEELVDYSNSTHAFGLKSVNCSLPFVPDSIPVARKVPVNITAEEAEEIAVYVFGFTEPYEIEGEINPTIRTDEERLSFGTFYDIMYHGDYPDSFNTWNETNVIETAEAFLAKLEPYWIDETPLNYSIIWVAPSHISSASPLTSTVREVGVRYQNTLEGIPLEGPGADFGISVCQYEVSSCEIRRPVIAVEGYTEVTITPIEAIQLMLRGESATPEIGFEVLQVLPKGSMLTITDVRLVYYTDLLGEWLVPVYVIRGVAHIDPVIHDEETSDFWWYVFAVDTS
jgi:hypothetical protein